MHGVAAAQSARAGVSLRYDDQGAYRWLWSCAPCRWRDAIELHFTEVPFQQLRSAGSWLHAAVVEQWLRRIARGHRIPPPVVSAAPDGSFYLHDGNHRWAALRRMGATKDERIRVALAVPQPGFHFRYRWFGHYETYSLEPVMPAASGLRRPRRVAEADPLLGRTLVLVAHPDDESGCAGLLQRIRQPLVVFATSGAPAGAYFWGRFGSRDAYGQVRRSEARRSLASIGISTLRFLEEDLPGGPRIADQELYRALPLAFDLVRRIITDEHPDALLVPAYEGGHPDHDACSFLGHLLGRHAGVPVWEMPLYHRADTGALVCQRFRQENGAEILIRLGAAELRRRAAMISSYVSQSDLTRFVSSPVECFRPQPAYCYAQRPHAGVLNYEAWQWPISPEEVCRAFAECGARVAPAARTLVPAWQGPPGASCAQVEA